MKPEGGGATVEELNATANGTYTPDEGVDGFAPVNVSVPASAVDSGTININSNGTHDVTGYASAEVSVSGGGGAGKTGTLNIASNVGNTYIDLMTTAELGFTPHVFAIVPKTPDLTAKCTLILAAVDCTDINSNHYGNIMIAWTGTGRTSSPYGQAWTNTGSYANPRLRLYNGTIAAKGSSDWPLQAGDYQWYAI